MSESSTSTSSGIESDKSDYEERPVYRRCRSRYYIIEQLVREFTSYDEEFKMLFGITRDAFNHLKNMISRDIITNHTCFRDMRPIRPKDRIGICLRFLTSGSSFMLLSLTYELNFPIIQTIVLEVCNTIVEHLQPITMPRPDMSEWRRIAIGFRNKHFFPNCIGVLNGRSACVMNDENYVLLSLVNCNQKFIMIDIAYFGDGPIQDMWDNSQMGVGFANNLFNVPSDRRPTRLADPLPYVIVAGSSFLPKPYMITQYKDAQHVDTDINRVFDGRINPVKKTADLAVARLRRRWQIVKSNIPVPLAMAKVIVTTTCCLENYFDDSDDLLDYSATKVITKSKRIKMRNSLPKKNMTLKERFLKFFLSYDGEVSWQYNLFD